MLNTILLLLAIAALPMWFKWLRNGAKWKDLP